MKRTVFITPVLQREHLAKAIRSVSANGCDHIIVNDSDKPLTIEQDSATVLNNNVNRGVGYSRRKGVSAALSRGYDFIGFVDADSFLSPNWVAEARKVLDSAGILGVSGVALNPNQRSRIARVKFALKDYGRRRGVPFQIDCSLFRREVFDVAGFENRRAGEDSLFIQSINLNRLRVCSTAISYHHETESAREFFRKELMGAFYALTSPRRVALAFLLTPITCLKMAWMSRQKPDYALTALVYLVRQLGWTLSFFIARAIDYGPKNQRMS